MSAPHPARAELARDVDRVESLRAIKDLERAAAHARPFETSGGLLLELVDQPLVTLSRDGESARGRWLSLTFAGDGRGGTRTEGGILENEYARVDGAWRLAERGYSRQFEGDHPSGWTNVGGADLPIVPYHFTVDEIGAPVPTDPRPAPPVTASLAELEARIARLADEDAVRNLQHAYGYYVDRRMWSDIVDLHDDPAGIRESLEESGPEGLAYGQLHDRPLFATVVRVSGDTAVARSLELGMLGDAAAGEAAWEFGVLLSRFVRRDGLWRITAVERHTILRADYREGWGGPADTAGMPPLLGARLLPSAGPDLAPETPARLADAARRLARVRAVDGVENVSAAYGFYLDDFRWPELGALFAENGNKQSPFAGYYLGRERIIGSVTANWGDPPETRPGISYHWRTQPVIHVAHDGRSAHVRTRLFQPRTWKEPSRPGEFYAAGFHGGMYPNDQAVLEDGVWRLWSLTIDEPYFTSVDWDGGWSAVVPSGEPPRPSRLLELYPPDVPMTALGRREEHFRGGTGELIEWPGILPMWFHYRNPVSGRTPERYWPDCVPSELLPQSRMTAHGYLMPPNGPEVDGIELDGIELDLDGPGQPA